MCLGRHQEVCKIWSSGNVSKEVSLPNSASAMWVPGVSDNSRITTALLLPSPQRATQRVGNGAVLQIHAPLVPILLWMCRLKCPDREVSSQPPWPAIFNTEFLTLSGYTKPAEGSCISSMGRESSLHSVDTKNSLLQLSSQFGEIRDSPGFLVSIFTRVSFPHCAVSA